MSQSPQINIWHNPLDGTWQLCMWVPKPHVLTYDPVLLRTKPSTDEYFVRERRNFESLPELLLYLLDRSPTGEKTIFEQIKTSTDEAWLDKLLSRYREADTVMEAKIHHAVYVRMKEIRDASAAGK